MTPLSDEPRGDETAARPPDEAADPWRSDIPGVSADPPARGALRILILEDQPSDAELEQRLLRRAGLDFTAVVVDTEETFLRELDALRPEVILSDHNLPGFSDGEGALADPLASGPRLLTFGRGEVLQPCVLNINDVIADARHLLSRALGEHIELATVLAGDLCPVFADRAQIERVLIDLAVNARDAMPAGGRLTIETAGTELDEPHTGEPDNLPAGSYVRVRVCDTGTGIPREVIDRVFEPFFTTKPQGAGIGLGLAAIYGIITRADGAITIDSELGHGTTVTIMLPVTDRAGAPAREPDRGAGTVVLLVEDEPAVLEMTRRMLDRSGYQMLTAATGHDALALASQQGQIDVLLTDVMMPEMSGKELADRVRDLRPGIRVLFMSGYTQGALSERDALEPGIGFLGKPFSKDLLLAKLNEVLA